MTEPTTGDYLWDRSGEPDPEVARLERALSEFRHAGAPPSLAAFRARRWLPFAAAAAVLVAAAAALLARGGATRVGAARPETSWSVAALEGTPRVGAARVDEAGRIAVGQWLETDALSRARLEIPDLGHVQVGPSSRVRLVGSDATEHRLALARGSIEATTWAPPRVFFVETPTAVAADLGCRFTLDVDADGASVLRVMTGWVSFERDGRESVVPRGAVCRTRPGVGPGTPRFEDASEALAASLDRVDFESGGDAALSSVLSESRPRDTLTLWHLLSRTSSPARERVYARMSALVPPPSGATREATLALQPSALALWKSAVEDAW